MPQARGNRGFQEFQEQYLEIRGWLAETISAAVCRRAPEGSADRILDKVDDLLYLIFERVESYTTSIDGGNDIPQRDEDDDADNPNGDDDAGNDSRDDDVGNGSEYDDAGNGSGDDNVGNDSGDDNVGNGSEDDDAGNGSEDDDVGNGSGDDNVGNDSGEDDVDNGSEDDDVAHISEEEDVDVQHNFPSGSPGEVLEDVDSQDIEPQYLDSSQDEEEMQNLNKNGSTRPGVRTRSMTKNDALRTIGGNLDRF